MHIHSLLEQAGLHEREAKVYAALMKLGPSTVLPIAEEAEVKRTYCYDILDSLISMGLVSYFEKNGRRRYVAEDPTTLERMLKKRLENFSQSLPELRSIYTGASEEKPVVRLYEGIEGLKTVYENLWKYREYVGIASATHLEKNVLDIVTHASREVVRHRVQARELYTPDTKPLFNSGFKLPLQEWRYLPEGTSLATDTLIFEDRVITVAYGERIFAVETVSRAIAQAQWALFELLWEQAKA